MEIKIISDGTVNGTRVINKETGEKLKNIESIQWNIDAKDKMIARATLIFIKTEVELIGEIPEETKKED